MNQIAAITWSLATLLSLSACATREIQTDEQPAQQTVAAQTGAEPESELPEAPAAPLQTEPSPGTAKFGRALAGGLGGAVVGAFAPAYYLGRVAGPIGIAVGLYLAPVGAAVGTVVGIAKSTSH